MATLAAWLDPLPEGQDADPHTRRRARLLVLAATTGLFTSLFFAVMESLWFEAHWAGVALGLMGLALVVVRPLVAAGRTSAALSVLVAEATAGVVVGGLVHRNYPYGALVFLVVLPMMAYYLGERRVARWSSGTALGVLAVFWVRHALFVPQHGIVSPVWVEVSIGTFCLGLCGVVVIAFARRSSAEWTVAVAGELEARSALAERERLESVGRLAGGVAHDFNNVLTALLASAELALETLEDMPGTEEVREDLRSIASGARRGGNLARQLLVATRKDTGSARPLCINTLLRRMQRPLSQRVGPAGVVELELEPELPAVRVDRYRMEQVVNNLVTNARDALGPDGRVVLRTRRVRGAGAGAAAHVELIVEDDGVGMDAETCQKAVEPFFTTKSMAEDTGTGLGLWTARGVVEDAGGRLEIASTAGVGTAVRLVLPAVDVPGELTTRRARFTAGRASAAVLVVEDETAIRRLVQRILDREGYRVEVAPDGDAALRRFRELLEVGAPPDLVFTDLIMPGMGGLEMAAEIATIAPDQRLAFMSGFAGDEAAAGGTLPSGALLLQKPFDVAGLVAHVRGALE